MRSHSIATDSPIKKIVAEKINKDDESAVRFMKCAYFLAKNELPKSLFLRLILYAEFVNRDFKKETKFICNAEITTATADAETIVNVVLAEQRH